MQHIDKHKDKHHLIITIDKQRACDKPQEPLMIKKELIPKQTGCRRSIPEQNQFNIQKTIAAS